ncbi:MAG: hypothetical protein LUC45_07620 [Paraprevotella sp.]|nr:hypothetical protein [Paraprevotella sp.]
MRRLSVIISVAVALCGAVCGFTACDESVSFTTNRAALLSFSTDTVQFDTVISTIGSSTRQLMVYNRNGDGLRIASVRLQKGNDTHFRVNVDGSYLEPESGARAYDFEVRKGDSICVFAEVTMPENGQDAPVALDDTLIFTLESGVEQSVMLAAVGQDAYLWRGKVIDSDTLLEAGRPIVIYDSLSVKEGVTLSMNPGVELYFHDGANLWVHGRIAAAGTMTQPVVFRGDRTDRMFDYLPYDNTPSHWGGIRLEKTSAGNLFDYVDIHSASYGIACDSSSTDTTKLTLTNSVIHNVGGEGLGIYHCRAYVGNTQVSNTLGHCVAVVGGWAEFVQCTLAQFYPWDASRGDALYLSNRWLEMDYPLEHAYFLNCLVTGYADDVIMGNLKDDQNDVDYYFGNCVLRTVESEDAARFVNVVYEKKGDQGTGQDQFKRFDTDNYLYDFRLDSLSVARDKGALEWAKRYPTDPYGVSRVSDAGPDAGCYEFAPGE